MKTIKELEDAIKYYRDLQKKAKNERRFRIVEGCQQNIDRCYDNINQIKRGIK